MIELYSPTTSMVVSKERCAVEKNYRVRNCGSQSQNAQWNKHLLSEAQRVPRSTLIWAISGWSNFSEEKHGTKRAVVVMMNWRFAFTFGERYLWILWILLLDDESVSSAVFSVEKKSRGKKTEEEKKSRKIRSQRNLWIKGIVQFYYLYVS